MPGPVSDSYDPEFGTSANAAEVVDVIASLRDRISRAIGDPVLQDIVDVVHGPSGRRVRFAVTTEREARVLRFALNRALEDL
jgi:hypothetical protein